jgi:hypothetical protein
MTCSLNMIGKKDEKFKSSHLHIWKNLIHINNASLKPWIPLGLQKVL